MIRLGFPDFDNILFPADAGQGRIALAWVDRRFPRKRFYADVLSAGTLCFLACAAALIAPEEPSLIAFDEPEQHLHPELLYRLVGLIEQAVVEKWKKKAFYSEPEKQCFYRAKTDEHLLYVDRVFRDEGRHVSESTHYYRPLTRKLNQ